MPRNQGTSRKGKPGRKEREAGMGKALQRAHNNHGGGGRRNRSGAPSGGGMMAMIQQHDGEDDDHVHQEGNNNSNTNTKSILELNDIDDFLLQAEMALREFATERGDGGVIRGRDHHNTGLLVLEDATGYEYNPATTTTGATTTSSFNSSTRQQGKTSDPLNYYYEEEYEELPVPRRPAWDTSMTSKQLNENEQRAFLDWRRSIAVMEEERIFGSSSTSTRSRIMTTTPFEKNIEVWKQLWRVIERCDILIQIVDARNPLFYLSSDLRAYCTDEHMKPTMVIINKADYLTKKQRQEWNRPYKTQPLNELSPLPSSTWI